MKRIFYYLLITVMVFLPIPVLAMENSTPYEPSANEIIFNQSMFKVDAIDPLISTNKKGVNYPGLRGANQLLIYTPNFGFRTGTNEFGTEDIVIDNTVVSLSGADSLIPENGFVISGHGQAK